MLCFGKLERILGLRDACKGWSPQKSDSEDDSAFWRSDSIVSSVCGLGVESYSSWYTLFIMIRVIAIAPTGRGRTFKCEEETTIKGSS